MAALILAGVCFGIVIVCLPLLYLGRIKVYTKWTWEESKKQTALLEQLAGVDDVKGRQ